MTWHRIAGVSELPESGLFRAEADGKGILLVKTGGKLFATQLRCAHEDDDLSTGTLEDGKIVCGFHFASYDPNSGKLVTPPQDGGDAGSLKTYSVKAENDDVLVDI